MKVRSQEKYIRMSPQKIRLVANLIRGLDVIQAEGQLRFVTKQKAAQFLDKALKSATANAIHNHGMVKDNLYIAELLIGGGPMLKRWRPRAFGRAFPIRRRTSHITLVLDERVEGKRTGKKPVEGKKAEIKEGQKVEAKKDGKNWKAESKEQKPKVVDKKVGVTNLKNKFFRRKSG